MVSRENLLRLKKSQMTAAILELGWTPANPEMDRERGAALMKISDAMDYLLEKQAEGATLVIHDNEVKVSQEEEAPQKTSPDEGASKTAVAAVTKLREATANRPVPEMLTEYGNLAKSEALLTELLATQNKMVDHLRAVEESINKKLEILTNIVLWLYSADFEPTPRGRFITPFEKEAGLAMSEDPEMEEDRPELPEVAEPAVEVQERVPKLPGFGRKSK
jgi:hypothetical protein